MPTEFFIHRSTKATAVVPMKTTLGRDNHFVVRFRHKTDCEGVVVSDRYLIDSDPNWVKATNKQLFEDEYGYPVYEGETWWYITDTHTKPMQTSTMVYGGTNPRPVKRFLYYDDAVLAIRNRLKTDHLRKLVGEFETVAGFKFTKKQLEILDNKI